MNANQKQRCHYIIHTHAALSGVANAAPIPGLGFAVDTATLTTMAMCLAAVYGGDVEKSVARNMAINAIRRTVLKQPIKAIAKELSKLVPWLGQAVAPAVSIVMLEAAGWSLANDMDRMYACCSGEP